MKKDKIMKIDARVRYTKMIIKKCFADLLTTKPIRKVTVTDICEAAEINRATFYRYYDNPYDLMEKIEDELSERFFNEIAPLPSSDIKGRLVIIMQEMKKEPDFYKALFSENGDPSYLNKCLVLVYKDSSVYLHERYTELSLEKQEYLFYFIALGGASVISQWVKNRMRTSVEETAEFLEHVISATLDNI